MSTSYPATRSHLGLRDHEIRAWSDRYMHARADGCTDDEAVCLADEAIADRRASKCGTAA